MTLLCEASLSLYWYCLEIQNGYVHDAALTFFFTFYSAYPFLPYCAHLFKT